MSKNSKLTKEASLYISKGSLQDKRIRVGIYCTCTGLMIGALSLFASTMFSFLSTDNVSAQVTLSSNTSSPATTTGTSETLSMSSATSRLMQTPLDQQIAWQGLISSSPSVLPDRNDTQTAIILIPRSDGGMYNGILTYHSTRPVAPVVWNVVRLDNSTAVIPEEFGETEGEIRSLIDLNSGRTAQVVLAAVQDTSTSGALPFSGDAIELAGEEGAEDEPFLVSYSLTAIPSLPAIATDLETISNFNETANEEDEEEEDTDA